LEVCEAVAQVALVHALAQPLQVLEADADPVAARRVDERVARGDRQIEPRPLLRAAPAEAARAAVDRQPARTDAFGGLDLIADHVNAGVPDPIDLLAEVDARER